MQPICTIKLFTDVPSLKRTYFEATLAPIVKGSDGSKKRVFYCIILNVVLLAKDHKQDQSPSSHHTDYINTYCIHVSECILAKTTIIHTLWSVKRCPFSVILHGNALTFITTLLLRQ